MLVRPRLDEATPISSVSSSPTRPPSQCFLTLHRLHRDAFVLVGGAADHEWLAAKACHLVAQDHRRDLTTSSLNLNRVARWSLKSNRTNAAFACAWLDWVQFPEFTFCLEQYRYVWIRFRP